MDKFKYAPKHLISYNQTYQFYMYNHVMPFWEPEQALRRGLGRCPAITTAIFFHGSMGSCVLSMAQPCPNIFHLISHLFDIIENTETQMGLRLTLRGYTRFRLCYLQVSVPVS